MIVSFSNSLCRGLGRFLLGELRPGGRQKAEMESRCLLADDGLIQERKFLIPLHHHPGREGDGVTPWFLQTDKAMRTH